MKAPVVVAAGSEVFVFRSLEEAERSVEPRNAVSGDVRAWDATGQRLRFDIDDALCLDLANVSLSALPNAPADHDGLRSTLQTFLGTAMASLPDDLTLDELIRRVMMRGHQGD